MSNIPAESKKHRIFPIFWPAFFKNLTPTSTLIHLYSTNLLPEVRLDHLFQLKWKIDLPLTSLLNLFRSIETDPTLNKSPMINANKVTRITVIIKVERYSISLIKTRLPFIVIRLLIFICI
jgi:hypothetical protein